MRGKAFASSTAFQQLRITPAHAGKRDWVVIGAETEKDHPRPCGEKFAGFNVSTFNGGSPPPMRGKGPIFALHFRPAGITPAHAGKRILEANAPEKY